MLGVRCFGLLAAEADAGGVECSALIRGIRVSAARGEEVSSMTEDTSITFFQEVQYMRQWWIVSVVIGSNVVALVIAVMIWSKFAPQMLPWGGIIFGLLMVGITILTLSSKLITEVRSNGLYIRYFPFHWSFHKIPLENVSKIEAVTYSPLRDYGGYGIRYGKGGRAYNAMGNRGVRINYSDGKHMLIGSQKPDELARAIESVMSTR